MFFCRKVWHDFTELYCCPFYSIDDAKPKYKATEKEKPSTSDQKMEAERIAAIRKCRYQVSSWLLLLLLLLKRIKNFVASKLPIQMNTDSNPIQQCARWRHRNPTVCGHAQLLCCVCANFRTSSLRTPRAAMPRTLRAIPNNGTTLWKLAVIGTHIPAASAKRK